MSQKELTKTFVMISHKKALFSMVYTQIVERCKRSYGTISNYLGIFTGQHTHGYGAD